MHLFDLDADLLQFVLTFLPPRQRFGLSRTCAYARKHLNPMAYAPEQFLTRINEDTCLSLKYDHGDVLIPILELQTSLGTSRERKITVRFPPRSPVQQDTRVEVVCDDEDIDFKEVMEFQRIHCMTLTTGDKIRCHRLRFNPSGIPLKPNNPLHLKAIKYINCWVLHTCPDTIDDFISSSASPFPR